MVCFHHRKKVNEIDNEVQILSNLLLLYVDFEVLRQK